ncbi:MAG: hypothetical protein JWQ20_2327 [Conexibacter sp.]|nr:hypothetical protein [Conexibacter sp.]
MLALLPAVVIAILVWPLLLVRTGFGGDWATHLWFVWHQASSLVQDHRPSLYLQYEDGVFYPHFAFYGGTLFSVVGFVSAVLGGAGRPAYILSWVVAFAAAYGGWLWLARMAGLRRWFAHAPAILFVTSPYYLTLVYVRGDWPEFMAVSAMPPLAAATVGVLRADRLRPAPALALAAAAIVFGGSHNLTLLWGGTILVVFAVALCLAVPQARRQVTRRGVLRVLGLVVPALLANAWYLVPDAAYQSHTVIASHYGLWRDWLRETSYLVSSGRLFALGRASVDPGVPHFVLALPVLAMAWVLVTAGLLLRSRRASPWMRTLLVVAAVTAALIVLMTHAGLVLALPRPFVMVQFTYRLESYVLLGICGAVLAALVLLRDAPSPARRWAWVVLPVLAVSLIGAAAQVAAYPRGGGFSTFRTPAITSMGVFADATLVELATDPPVPKVTFPADQVRGDRVSVTVPLDPGQVVDTNLMVMPELIHVEGAQILGNRTTVERQRVTRHAILRIDPDATPGLATITVTAAHPWPVTVGRLLSLLGLLGLLAHAAVPAVRGGWRRARGAAAGVDPSG